MCFVSEPPRWYGEQSHLALPQHTHTHTQTDTHDTYCVSGVNLLIGTENGLVLLDRSGQGKSQYHTCYIVTVTFLRVLLSVL